MLNKTMSIYAEALISNRDFKNARVDGNAIGITKAREWTALIKSALIPAYTVYKYRYDNMGNKEVAKACNMDALYNAIRPIIALIGEVNGDKLNAENIAEEFVSKSVRIRAIDTSNEMAHAREEYRQAKSNLANSEQGTMSDEEYAVVVATLEAKVESTKAEVSRLIDLPGNCKNINSIQTDTAFVKAIEIALGDAITKQTLRPVEDILAEKAQREADRKARRKANKLAKKAATTK